ncbi:MAG: phage capsid protein [Pseudomonadota bacterium]
MAEETLEEHYRVAYQQNLGAEYQQKMQRLGGTVDDDYNFVGGEQNGTSFTADIVGTSRVTRINDRYGDTPSGEPNERRRRGGHFEAFDIGSPLGNKIDNARSVADPSSRIVMEERQAIARHHDDRIMTGIIGPAFSGRTLTDRNNLSTDAVDDDEEFGAIIPVDSHEFDTLTGQVGFTASKVQTAKRIFDLREIDDEGRYCAADANMLAQLLNDEKLSNNDYNTIKALVTGQIDMWHGFKFVKYQRTAQVAAEVGIAIPDGQAPITFWHKNAVQYRSRVIKTPMQYMRQEKRHNWYTYGEMEHAAARTHDNAVLMAFALKPGVDPA